MGGASGLDRQGDDDFARENEALCEGFLIGPGPKNGGRDRTFGGPGAVAMKRGDRVTEREQTPVEKLAEVLKVHGGVGKSI